MAVDLEGKVAVVTGAGSGIGRAIAAGAAARGMAVILADLHEDRLSGATAAITASGGQAWSVVTDVSDPASVAELAQKAAGVGDVWLLVNNAGVFLSGPFLEMPRSHWEFVLGVNLWGVVHGLQAFLPGMVARGTGHVVNTASVDGLVTVENAASYVASKHAVIGLSETVYRELTSAGTGVGVSVLCPGAVPTAILDAAPHWPSRLGAPPPSGPAPDAYPELDEMMTPAQVADIVFEAVAARRFWVLTHASQYGPAMRARTEGAIAGRNPDDESVDPNFRSDRGRKPGSYGDAGGAVTGRPRR